VLGARCPFSFLPKIFRLAQLRPFGFNVAIMFFPGFECPYRIFQFETTRSPSNACLISQSMHDYKAGKRRIGIMSNQLLLVGSIHLIRRETRSGRIEKYAARLVTPWPAVDTYPGCASASENEWGIPWIVVIK
jgi:hypothetical protein